MYFIVYFLAPKIHVIIPQTWIHGIKDHWEKFVNNSINKNQKFVCYYSQCTEAMNEGRPNADFVPDFSLRLDPNFPADGCYVAKLLLYKGKSK